MPRNLEAIESRSRRVTNFLRTPGKLLMTGITALTALTACGNNEDVNHYARNAPAPHEIESFIPDGKVFPSNGAVEFSENTAKYTASSDVTKRTGILAITAFCGNPIDKRDPHNLYASIETISKDDGTTQTMAAIRTFDACSDDGKLSRNELPLLN